MAQNSSEDFKPEKLDDNFENASESVTDMKELQENLHSTNIHNGGCDENCSDDEYIDAKDDCDTDLEELDDEALKEHHKNLSDVELKVLSLEYST